MTAPMTATTSTTTNVTMPAPTSYHPVTPAAPAFDYSDYPVLEKRIAVRATSFSTISLENIDDMDITARTRGVVFQSFSTKVIEKINEYLGDGSVSQSKKLYPVRNGSTILHLACQGWGENSGPSIHNVELIVRHRDIGKIINAVDSEGKTPFYTAVIHRASVKILRLLLAAGAFPDVQPVVSTWNSLHTALGFSKHLGFGYNFYLNKEWPLAAITIIKGTFSPSKQDLVQSLYETLVTFPRPLISICTDYAGCGLERVVQLVRSIAPMQITNTDTTNTQHSVKWTPNQLMNYQRQQQSPLCLSLASEEEKQKTKMMLKILSAAGGADKPINPDQLRIELVEAEASLDPVGFHLPVD